MYGRFDYYGVADIDREMALEEARRMKTCPVCKKEVPVLSSGELMSHTIGKAGKMTCPGSLGKAPGKVTAADVKRLRVGHYMHQELPDTPSLSEGRKQRKWIRIKASMFKGASKKEEDIQAEIDRLEATSSPFPEVRERRIAELRTELDEARSGRKPPGGRGLGVGKPAGGRGLGPGGGKGPYRGTGMGPGTGKCKSDESVEEAEELTERKQALMTAKARKDLPELYSQENVKDPMVYLKLFSPYMRKGYWLVTEFDGKDTLFGAANIGHGWELGYSSLDELENAKGPGGVQAIERDQLFKPKTLSKAKAEISRDRGEN